MFRKRKNRRLGVEGGMDPGGGGSGGECGVGSGAAFVGDTGECCTFGTKGGGGVV
jgi:hypothetical protein